MKNYFNPCIILFTFFLLLTATTRCQTHGKIFARAEADQLFGAVKDSVILPVSELHDFLDQSNNFLMFSIKDGNLIVLGDEREPVYPDSISVPSTDVFEVFSKSIITELLKSDGPGVVYIEKRKSVLTITFGKLILEQGANCPPFCP